MRPLGISSLKPCFVPSMDKKNFHVSSLKLAGDHEFVVRLFQKFKIIFLILFLQIEFTDLNRINPFKNQLNITFLHFNLTIRLS